MNKKLALVGSLIYLIAVLWITLFSRLGQEIRSILIPFWSYREIVLGDLDVLEEDIKNVLLFVPFGFFLCCITGWKTRYIFLSGMLFSILIEICQWLLRLGSAELDDVINNSIGAIIGSLLTFHVQNRKRFVAGILSVLILIMLPSSIRLTRLSSMKAFAEQNDLENGRKNLLVLNGNPGRIWPGRFRVFYNDNGSITISGSSDVRSWKQIGNLCLEPGKYSFFGLSGVKRDTVAIELEYYNKEKKKFIRLTPDVGPIDMVEFVLLETTEIRAYVGVYPGAEGTYIARPVVYREE